MLQKMVICVRKKAAMVSREVCDFPRLIVKQADSAALL